jgi:hypothetical protein
VSSLQANSDAPYANTFLVKKNDAIPFGTEKALPFRWPSVGSKVYSLELCQIRNIKVESLSIPTVPLPKVAGRTLSTDSFSTSPAVSASGYRGLNGLGDRRKKMRSRKSRLYNH